MTRDPIRRRFGHGAARLPLGMPPTSERLSERARQPVEHERRLTLVLPLVAACVAGLVVTALKPVQTLSPPAVGEIQIVLDAWSASPQTAFSKPEPRPEPKPESKPKPKPAEVAVARRAAPSPAVPAGRPTDSRAMPAGLAAFLPSRLTAPSLDSIGSGSSRFAGIGDRRPQASGTGSSVSAGLVSSSRGDQERSAFLAAVELETGSSGKRGAGAAPATRRPFVSAARATLPGLSSGSNGSNGDGVDGWQEVPLDALPDCSPPGRQDLLKKRILLAAPFGRECSHPGGSYRFVETRNLGAFLMWSRPNPDARAGQPRDRDACDVLERALRCIDDRSSQESSPR